MTGGEVVDGGDVGGVKGNDTGGGDGNDTGGGGDNGVLVNRLFCLNVAAVALGGEEMPLCVTALELVETTAVTVTVVATTNAAAAAAASASRAIDKIAMSAAARSESR